MSIIGRQSPSENSEFKVLGDPHMTKVLVLYYSSYGHIEKMAEAVAAGAREGGAEVAIKRVPELVPEEVARQRTSSSTKQRQSQRSMSFRTTTRSSSVCRPVSATCLPR